MHHELQNRLDPSGRQLRPDGSKVSLDSKKSNQKKGGRNKEKRPNIFKDKKDSVGTQYLDRSSLADKKIKIAH